MKIRNNGKEFIITFNQKDHKIPEGDIDVADEVLAAHIISKARQWGHNVENIGATEKIEIKPIEAIKVKDIVNIDKVEVVAPAPVEEVTLDPVQGDEKSTLTVAPKGKKAKK